MNAFCLSFETIVSCHDDVGGALLASATHAVHTSFFEVARIRADPLEKAPPAKFELIEIPAAPLVPKVTVAPGATLSDVATASLPGAPPPEPKSSMPTWIVAVSVELQPKNVASPPAPEMTFGTE